MMRGILPAFFLAFLLSLPAAARGEEETRARRWNVSVTQSTLTFTAKQMGKEFTGAVKRFTPEIYFDPDDLAHSYAEVAIDVASIGTGDKDRDRAVEQAAWFDTAAHPTARFVSDSFRKTGEGAFAADGTLTIKGASAPVTLNFTFDLPGGTEQLKSVVKGTAVVDRSAFGLGTGDWADTSVIANEVTVHIDLIAYEDPQAAK